MARKPLDAIDRKILTVLQGDGRITNQALAERVGLSPSPCLARLRRLEEEGIIAGYGARLDPSAFSSGVGVVAIVALERLGRDAQSRFEAWIAKQPAITEAHEVSGEDDYMLRFITRDMAEYQELTARMLEDPEAGVDRIRSLFILREVKAGTGLPVALME